MYVSIYIYSVCDTCVYIYIGDNKATYNYGTPSCMCAPCFLYQ